MQIEHKIPERDRQLILLITAAIEEIDQVHDAKPQRYSSEDVPFFARRKMTMKDAKPKAKRASDLLRQAWELLDPL